MCEADCREGSWLNSPMTAAILLPGGVGSFRVAIVVGRTEIRRETRKTISWRHSVKQRNVENGARIHITR